MHKVIRSYFYSWFNRNPATASAVEKLEPSTIKSEVPLDIASELASEFNLGKGSKIEYLATKLASNRNENERHERYKLFNQMSEHSLISHAFQIYLSELCGDSISTERFKIGCDDEGANSDIRALIEQTKLGRVIYEIVRQAITYGDCFVELLVDPEAPSLGIQGLRILNPNLTYRIEDEFGRLEGYVVEVPQKREDFLYGMNQPQNTFIQLHKDQVVHFRLFTAENSYYPYGKSIAACVKSDFKKLTLLQDAMLIYRVTRAPSRMIHYIDTGALPASKAQMYLESQKDKLRKSKYQSGSFGQIEQRNDTLTLSEDYFVATNGKNSGTKIERLPSDTTALEIQDIVLLIRQICAGLNLTYEKVLGEDSGRGAVQQAGIAFSDTVDVVRSDISDGLTELVRKHLALIGDPNFLTAKLQVATNHDLRNRRRLDVEEQKIRLAQAQKSLGLIPYDDILRNTFGMSLDQIEDCKVKLVAQEEDLAWNHLRASDGISSSEDPSRLNSDSGENAGLELSVRNNRRGEAKHFPQEG
jgi:hypothetical protein